MKKLHYEVVSRSQMEAHRVEHPKAKSVYTPIVNKLKTLDTDQAIRIYFNNVKLAQTGQSTLVDYCKRHHLDFAARLRGNVVYLYKNGTH